MFRSSGARRIFLNLCSLNISSLWDEELCRTSTSSQFHPCKSLAIKLSGRTEPTTASLRVGNVFRPDWLWRDDLFDYQLADLAFCRQVDWLGPRVVEKTSDLTAVIG